MYARSRLDLSWTDLLVGLCAGWSPGDAQREAAALAADWDPRAAVFLTLRTAWDALLAELELPAGSEVLVSAVNIPDMFDLLRHHGLVPVPVDLDPDTLATDVEQLEQRASERTRLILVAQLLGARNDLDPIFAFAAERGLPVVLDLAQGWEGPETERDPRALATLFSFGPIKTSSALGGCLAVVGDDELRGRMVARAAGYPQQTEGSYAAVAAKYLAMKLLSLRPCYATFVVACRVLGKSHDAVINASVLGLKGADYWAALRRRPSRGLVRLLGRRLRGFGGRLAARTEVGRALAEATSGTVLGRGARSTFWLLGVVAEDPEALVKKLRRAGFDATSGSSRLRPCEHPRYATPWATAAMERVVYVPAYPELSAGARERLAALLSTSASPRAPTTPRP